MSSTSSQLPTTPPPRSGPPCGCAHRRIASVSIFRFDPRPVVLYRVCWLFVRHVWGAELELDLKLDQLVQKVNEVNLGCKVQNKQTNLTTNFSHTELEGAEKQEGGERKRRDGKAGEGGEGESGEGGEGKVIGGIP